MSLIVNCFIIGVVIACGLWIYHWYKEMERYRIEKTRDKLADKMREIHEKNSDATLDELVARNNERLRGKD
jgi:hypothetical protein